MRIGVVLVLAVTACGNGRASPPPASVLVGPVASVAASSTALTPGVRWAPPSCPLRYQVLVTETFDGAGAATKLVTYMTADLTPSAVGVEVHIVPTIALEEGKYRPYAVPDRGFPSFPLTTDGTRWQSPTGGTLLYTAYGTQGGLAWLFPDLASSWAFPIDEQRLPQNGLSALNSTAIAMMRPGKIVTFPLAEERSTTPDGRLVVRSRGPELWSSRQGADDLAVLERKGEIRAEHVLLPNGRLLRAHLERDVALTFTVEKSAPISGRITQRSDAHLVSACDGPTESALEPVLTREERAIAAVGDLGSALYDDARRATAVDAFTPALRLARGDAAILETVERYRRDRGERWWPIPVFVSDDDVTTRPDRVEVTARTTVRSPTRKHSVTSVVFVFGLVESGGHFLVDHVTARFEIEPGRAQLLEIGKARLLP